MKQVFLKKEGNPRLLLFFAGWGADEHLFHRPLMEGYDALLCFDYQSLDFDGTFLDGYQEIRLMAWSMGVWAAGQVLQGKAYPWKECLAVNGTPRPISDEYGIPEAVFEGTLRHFSEPVLVRFRRRICGSSEGIREFLSHAPYRPVESLHRELEALYRQVKSLPPDGFEWNRALIGRRDKIFPPAAQRNAWKLVDREELEVEHYDGELFDKLLAGEEIGWTKH